MLARDEGAPHWSQSLSGSSWFGGNFDEEPIAKMEGAMSADGKEVYRVTKGTLESPE